MQSKMQQQNRYYIFAVYHIGMTQKSYLRVKSNVKITCGRVFYSMLHETCILQTIKKSGPC